DDVLRGDERERVPDVAREIVADANRIRVDTRLGGAAGHEQRETGGVAADRRLGLGCAGLERPTRVFLGARPVAGEETCLDRADRAAPAPRRGVGEALAVALRGAREPLGR